MAKKRRRPRTERPSAGARASFGLAINSEKTAKNVDAVQGEQGDDAEARRDAAGHAQASREQGLRRLQAQRSVASRGPAPCLSDCPWSASSRALIAHTPSLRHKRMLIVVHSQIPAGRRPTWACSCASAAPASTADWACTSAGVSPLILTYVQLRIMLMHSLPARAAPPLYTHARARTVRSVDLDTWTPEQIAVSCQTQGPSERRL